MAKKNLYVLTGRNCDGLTDSWVVKAKQFPHLEKVVEKVFDPTAYGPQGKEDVKDWTFDLIAIQPETAVDVD